MQSVNYKEWTSGVRGRIALGVIVVFLLVAYTVHARESSRPPRPNLDPVNAEIQAIDAEIAVIQNMRPLAPLSTYWREAKAAAEVYGVQMAEMAPISNPDGTLAAYQGPLKAWHANIQGDFPVVIGFIREMQSKVPMFVYTIQKEGARGAAAVSFVGTEG